MGKFAGSDCGAAGGGSTMLLCDAVAEGVVTQFLRHFALGQTADPLTHTDTLLDGDTAYTVSDESNVFSCSDSSAAIVMCDVGSGGSVPFLRTYKIDANGLVSYVVDTALDGITGYSITGSVMLCGSQQIAVPLCDIASTGVVTHFLRRYHINSVGVQIATSDFALDGSTPYVAAGTVQICDAPVATLKTGFASYSGVNTWTPPAAPARLKSVTIICSAATVTINATTGSADLPVNAVITYSVDQLWQTLDIVSVAIGAGGAALIAWTYV